MTIYHVQPGDTICKLGARFRVPIKSILLANPGLYPYDLPIGQKIWIPSLSEEPNPALKI